MNDETNLPAGAATAEFETLRRALERNQRSHYVACERLEFLHAALGVFAVVAAIFVAVAYSYNFPYLHYILPAAALSASAASGIQSFRGLEAKSRDHKFTAAEYGDLHREARARVSGAYSDDTNAADLPEFLRRYSQVSKNAPLTRNRDRTEQDLLRQKRNTGQPTAVNTNP